MQLADYLRDSGQTASEFARKSGVGSRQVMHQYVKGHRFPTPENLRRIREATGGQVTADDFVDQHTAAPASPQEAA